MVQEERGAPRGKMKLAAFFYNVVTLFQYILEVARQISGRRDLEKRCHCNYLLSPGETRWSYSVKFSTIHPSSSTESKLGCHSPGCSTLYSSKWGLLVTKTNKKEHFTSIGVLKTHRSHLLGEEKYAYLFCCRGKKRTWLLLQQAIRKAFNVWCLVFFWAFPYIFITLMISLNLSPFSYQLIIYICGQKQMHYYIKFVLHHHMQLNYLSIYLSFHWHCGYMVCASGHEADIVSTSPRLCSLQNRLSTPSSLLLPACWIS